MSKRGRPRKGVGAVYQREDSQFWQVWYRDQKGEIQRESTSTTDRQEAERFLRDRLDARDEGRLSTVLNSKQLTFGQWADWFLERRSKPPFRSAGNHQQNVNALKFLRKRSVGDMPMTVEAREAFLRQIEEAPGSEYLFPSPKSTGSKPYITNVRKGWVATLKKAGIPYFAL